MERFADQLLQAFNHDVGIFPARTTSARTMNTRSHVACFADQVYAIQALARYHNAFVTTITRYPGLRMECSAKDGLTSNGQ